MDREAFSKPAQKYRMKTIIHGWPDECGILADAVRDLGYGGTATNPPTENGYTGNKENLAKFGRILEELNCRDMDYWIYDERGYPSGHGGGQSLEGYPELEAKGFYMHRRISWEPKTAVFDLDDESDRSIWAAKYPCDCSRMNTSIVLYDQMERVAFTDTHCEYSMKENEALFIFCVKSAYEGSHLTHNVSSKNRYINILDEKAVRRFLDVCYEPIVKEVPEAYKNAHAVFTDEPSLQTPYIQGDEVWPYALAPWVDGLFEKFEDEYGYSLLPYLPMIFEGRSSSYTVRVHFYQLIGKLVAKNYVKQISESRFAPMSFITVPTWKCFVPPVIRERMCWHLTRKFIIKIPRVLHRWPQEKQYEWNYGGIMPVYQYGALFRASGPLCGRDSEPALPGRLQVRQFLFFL